MVISEGEDYRCFLITSSAWIIFITRNLFLRKKKKRKDSLSKETKHTRKLKSPGHPWASDSCLGSKGRENCTVSPSRAGQKSNEEALPMLGQQSVACRGW